MNIVEKIEKHLTNEAVKYDDGGYSDKMKEIVSEYGVVMIKGSIPMASALLTKDSEKKFIKSNSIVIDDNYVVDSDVYKKITTNNKKIFKKWHKDNGFEYHG